MIPLYFSQNRVGLLAFFLWSVDFFLFFTNKKMHVNHNTHFRQFNILLSRHRNIPSAGLSAAPKEHGIPGSE